MAHRTITLAALVAAALAASGSTAHAPSLPAAERITTVDARLAGGAAAWNLHLGEQRFVVSAHPEIVVVPMIEGCDPDRSCSEIGGSRVYLAPGAWMSGAPVQAHELGHAAFGLFDTYEDAGECGHGIMGCRAQFEEGDRP